MPKTKACQTIEGGYSSAPCGVRWTKSTEKACIIALRLHKKTCIECRTNFSDSKSTDLPLVNINNRHNNQNKEHLIYKGINKTLVDLSTSN